MLSKYFAEFGKTFTKKSVKKSSKKEADSSAVDKKVIIESFSKIVPLELAVEDAKPIDSSGFSPDGIDFIAYRKHCVDISQMMNGYIPYELLRASFFVVPGLEKKKLFEGLNRIAMAKKMNTYSEKSDETSDFVVPAFMIVPDSDYDFLELKNDVVNYYLSKNIDNHCEVDIIVVLNRGLVIKNWREKRSFIALETNEDTNMWFYILMNEYIDVNKNETIDFRNYVKKQVVYKEY